VHGVMAPVGAVVVPDVVVGIRICIFHAPTSANGVVHPLS
jgi:flagellar biosynthesis protein FliQ